MADGSWVGGTTALMAPGTAAEKKAASVPSTRPTTATTQ
jgi:hypothetical protein